MILKNPNEGEKLDVAGLNEITVLIDRSETALTEVGFNKWRTGLEGPPHAHDQKEQMFFITAGIGTILLGPEKFAVRPNQLVYVPAGVRHQSLVGSEEPLVYLLFNAFSNADKEGHASFADHIETVKMDRKAQAEGTYQEDPEKAEAARSRKGKWVEDLTQCTPIIDKSETARCEALLFKQASGTKSENRIFPDKEQTLYVLSGRGRVTLEEERADLKEGDVLFIPSRHNHTLEAVGKDLTCLCLNTIL